jgi:hypothetical protein
MNPVSFRNVITVAMAVARACALDHRSRSDPSPGLILGRRVQTALPWLIALPTILAGAMAVAAGAAVKLPTHPGCPNTAPVHVARNIWARAKGRLAPSGANRIRLCRYAGSDARPPAVLLRSRPVTEQTLIRRLVRDYNLLPAFPRAVSCPSDRGSQILALLEYPGRRRVAIQLKLTGCQPVTNGDLIRTAAGFGSPPAFGPALGRELEQLTR